MKKLPLSYVGYTVCNGVSSNIEVVRQFSVFYKEHIYYKGLHNDLEVRFLEEINELMILSSTAISETTETEATKLIPRFIKFFNMFSPKYVTFKAVLVSNVQYEKFGFYSNEEIEFYSAEILKAHFRDLKTKLVKQNRRSYALESLCEFIRLADTEVFNLSKDNLAKIAIIYTGVADV